MTDQDAPLLVQLLLALLQRDHARFCSLLPHASPDDLAAIAPLSMFHAAALVGDADAVRLLAAAGAPAAAADAVCNGPAALRECSRDDVLFSLEPAGKALQQCHAAATGIAVWKGHTDVLAALLAAGAAPDAPSLSLHDLTVDHSVIGGGPLTPLDLVVLRPIGTGPQLAGDDMARQLLAAGATLLRPDALRRGAIQTRGGSTACLLLQCVFEASQAGKYIAPGTETAQQELIEAAAACDATEALDHFAAQLLTVQRPDCVLDAVADAALRAAAECNSAATLQLAAQAAQMPAAQHSSATASLLGRRWEAKLPSMLKQAAKANHTETLQVLLSDVRAPAAVHSCSESLLLDAAVFGSTAALQLLLDAGATPTAQVLHATVCAGCRAMVEAVLAHGRPCFEDVHWAGYNWVMYGLARHGRRWYYSCPALAVLQLRVTMEPYGLDMSRLAPATVMHHPQAVHPWDARLLPIAEALASAGYRPRIYVAGELVKLSSDPLLRSQLEGDFDPVQQDQSLQLGGINWWLWLAIERLAWTPGSHSRFPRSFRAAARTLLLAARRGGSADEATAAGACTSSSTEASAVTSGSNSAAPGEQPPTWAGLLGTLPAEMLLRIIGLAAYPLSAWVPLDLAATQAAMRAAGGA